MPVLFTASEIVAATCGRPVTPAAGPATKVPALKEQAVRSVVIDSRRAEKDCLFIPLAGARVDGHSFIEGAVRQGAGMVLVAAGRWPELKDGCQALARQSAVSFILVEDTLKALQDLAAYHIGRFPRLVRIGVTGSSGKTTTKEIIGRILSQAGETAVNEGNFNSDIGLPLSIFRVQPEHRFAVFEMGMNYPGEMDILARLVKPHLALITNIGRAHLEQLGSQEGIAREKKKVFKFFSGSERGFIYEAEPFYALLSEGTKGDIIPYGPRQTKGYRGAADLGLEGTTLYWEELQIRFPLIGQHNLLNALGAITLTSELGVEKEAIKKGLEAVSPLFGRSEIDRGEVTIIKDYYNANPDSVSAALEFFKGLSWPGRKVLVLGSMLELGAVSGQAHQSVGAEVVRLGFEHVFFFGREMSAAYETAAGAGKQLAFYWTEDFAALQAEVEKTVKTGDLLLIKGSRGMQLERLIEPVTRKTALRSKPGEPGEPLIGALFK